MSFSDKCCKSGQLGNVWEEPDLKKISLIKTRDEDNSSFWTQNEKENSWKLHSERWDKWEGRQRKTKRERYCFDHDRKSPAQLMEEDTESQNLREIMITDICQLQHPLMLCFFSAVFLNSSFWIVICVCWSQVEHSKGVTVDCSKHT